MADKQTQKEAAALESLADAIQSNLKGSKEQLRIRAAIADSLQSEMSAADKIVELDEIRLEVNEKYYGVTQNIADSLNSQIDLAKKLNTVVAAREDMYDEITDKVDDMYGSIMSNIESIPIIGEKITKVIDVTGVGDKFKTLFADKIQGAIMKTAEVFGVASTSIAASVAVATLGIAALVAAVVAFVKLGLHANEQVIDLAHNFSITKDEASELHHELLDAVQTSDTWLANNESISEAYQDITSNLGVMTEVNKQLLEDQIELTKYFGLSGDEAYSLLRLTNDQMSGSKAVAAEIEATVVSYNMANRSMVRGNAVMKAIANTTAEVRMLMHGNVQELAKAALVAGKYGASLEDVKDMTDDLLDIESSLQAEMEARVMTGKQINLDKAREAALSGDLATASKELMDNVGSTAEFRKMDRLQQESLSKAMGVSVGQMSEMLEYSEMRAKFGKKLEEATDKEIRDSQNLTATEKENLLMKRAEISAQEKFNLAITKMKDILVNYIVPYAEKFISFLEGAGPEIETMKSLFKFLGAALKVAFSPLILAYDIFKGIGQLLDGDVNAALKTIGSGITDYITRPLKAVSRFFGIFSDSASEMADDLDNKLETVKDKAFTIKSAVSETKAAQINPPPTATAVIPSAQQMQITNQQMATDNPELLDQMKKQNELMQTLISNVSQPAVIKIGNKAIKEIDKVSSLQRKTRANVDNTYGQLGA